MIAVAFFTSDNGPWLGKKWNGGSAGLLRDGKAGTWEGGYRAPLVVRWPGHIKPGTVLNDMFASYDWMPTFVAIAGGAKGNDLNKQIMEGKYPGIVKTKLNGVNQLDYLTGKSEKSARDTFFYYGGPVPSAVRYKNWKIYFAMASEAATGGLMGVLHSIGRWSTTSSGIRSRGPSVSNRVPLPVKLAHLPDR